MQEEFYAKTKIPCNVLSVDKHAESRYNEIERRRGMNIGESISKYRKKSGLTQQQLADRLYVSVDLVSKWECGSRRPDYGTIRTLADVFGVQPESIVGAGEMMMNELRKYVPDNIPADELPALISAYINDISERNGNIFMLRYYYFEEIKSIAAMTETSEANVRVILFRTRSGLKKYLRRNTHEQL